MVVYLDVCSLNRPLDDRSQVRVSLEAEAVLAIVALCDSGHFKMLSSEAIEYEVRQHPDAEKRAIIVNTLNKASTVITLSPEVIELARRYETNGIKPMDSLHLACATIGTADYFCTCDDRLLRRIRSMRIDASKAVTPLELIVEIAS